MVKALHVAHEEYLKYWMNSHLKEIYEKRLQIYQRKARGYNLRVQHLRKDYVAQQKKKPRRKLKSSTDLAVEVTSFEAKEVKNDVAVAGLQAKLPFTEEALYPQKAKHRFFDKVFKVLAFDHPFEPPISPYVLRTVVYHNLEHLIAQFEEYFQL
mmetsp:Transcript_14147/g.22053  ORF Transcript_14147/g.22053 Transcript_14147/m.22053 type:complete len:154 (-) Transcript_14147:837-1298(-)